MRINIKKISIFSFCLGIAVCYYAQAQTIAVYGDTRTDQVMHQKIVNQIIRCKPVAVFHVGDFSDGDTRGQEWQRFTTIISQVLKIADFYPVVGNHDQPFVNSFQQFVNPTKVTWYSVDIGSIHCIVLDSTADLVDGSVQNLWLQSDLKIAAKDKKFILIFLHHAPLGVGGHTDEKNLQMSLVPLCARYRITMVFSGHDHAYERAFYENTYYIVTGGGGAPLHDKKRKNVFNQIYKKAYNFCTIVVKDDTLVLHAYDDLGSLIDEVTLGAKK